MLGIIDVGGGMRGSYGAGVMDWCMDHGIRFDYGIGVSAGSANIASFFAGQRGRNYVYYTDYAFRREYMSMSNFLKTRNYIGMEYIYGTLSDEDGEYPLDFRQMQANRSPFWIVTTDAETGKPYYIDAHTMKQDDYFAIKASCSVPLLNEPYPVMNRPLYDGGMSDPVPFKKAFDDGCDHVVVVLTRPKEYRRVPETDETIAKLIGRKYPAAAEAMRNRAIVYNEQVDEAIELEKEGRVTILAPDDIGHMKTLTKDKGEIRNLYLKGYRNAAETLGHGAAEAMM